MGKCEQWEVSYSNSFCGAPCAQTPDTKTRQSDSSYQHEVGARMIFIGAERLCELVMLEQ